MVEATTRVAPTNTAASYRTGIMATVRCIQELGFCGRPGLEGCNVFQPQLPQLLLRHQAVLRPAPGAVVGRHHHVQLFRGQADAPGDAAGQLLAEHPGRQGVVGPGPALADMNSFFRLLMRSPAFLSSLYWQFHLPGVGDVSAAHRAYLRREHGSHGHCVAIKGQELYLKSFALAMYVHYGANIACLQSFLGNIARQNDPVMLFKHLFTRLDVPLSISGWRFLFQLSRQSSRVDCAHQAFSGSHLHCSEYHMGTPRF